MAFSFVQDSVKIGTVVYVPEKSSCICKHIQNNVESNLLLSQKRLTKCLNQPVAEVRKANSSI